jgi:rhodanese-related sulfurtransferase
MTWLQVKPLLEAGRIVLVDSRPKSAYDLGHIPGAVSLPSTAPLTEFQAFAAKYSKDTGFVVYCNSTTCRSSQQLAHQLISLGKFRNVSEMPGGFAEYTVAQAAQPKAKP